MAKLLLRIAGSEAGVSSFWRERKKNSHTLNEVHTNQRHWWVLKLLPQQLQEVGGVQDTNARWRWDGSIKCGRCEEEERGKAWQMEPRAGGRIGMAVHATKARILT